MPMMDIKLLLGVVPITVAWSATIGLGSFVSPILFSCYKDLSAPLQRYWACSLTSTIHAVLVVYLAVAALLESPEFYANSGDRDLHFTTPASQQCFQVFLGYILSDTFFVLWYRKRWPGTQATLVHHFTAIFTWVMLLGYGIGHTLGLVAMIAEFTTPFVNNRWFFDKAEMKDGLAYLLNGLMMTFSWFVVRVLGFIWLGTVMFGWRHQIGLLPIFHGATLVASYLIGLALQLFWFNKMVRGAIKTLRSKPGAKPSID